MEYLGNILGPSLEYPVNVPATSTFHLSTAAFEMFVFESENMLNSVQDVPKVHFVRKCSKSPKVIKIAEIVQNRRNRSKSPKVIKCGQM